MNKIFSKAIGSLFFSLSVFSLFACDDSFDPVCDVDYTEFVTVTRNEVVTTRGGSSCLPVNTKLKPYAIGKYEVTYELYFSVRDWANDNGYNIVGEGRCGSEPEDGKLPEYYGTQKRCYPASYIDWLDAVVWCNAYSEIDGREPVYYSDAAFTKVLRSSDKSVNSNPPCFKKTDAKGYRLPTSAEWEFAGRGANCNDTKTWSYIYAGSSAKAEMDDYAVWGKTSTEVVGSKKPNSIGLYDMSGNVWEMCEEKHARGGSYGVSFVSANSNPLFFSYKPFSPCYGYKDDYLGFRLVLSF